uniref:Uncharacterized protein n=1 Tax=Trichuris muris TaxID=70415 RepID=A0A5S6Q2P1_TRIMR
MKDKWRVEKNCVSRKGTYNVEPLDRDLLCRVVENLPWMIQINWYDPSTTAREGLTHGRLQLETWVEVRLIHIHLKKQQPNIRWYRARRI